MKKGFSFIFLFPFDISQLFVSLVFAESYYQNSRLFIEAISSITELFFNTTT